MQVHFNLLHDNNKAIVRMPTSDSKVFCQYSLRNKHFNAYLYLTSIRCETQNNKITLLSTVTFSIWLRHSCRWKKGNITSKLCGI